MSISHQIEAILKELKITKKNQLEILELKSTITKTTNSLEGLSSRCELPKERVSKLEIDG